MAKTPARAKTPASARGQRAKTPASETSARGQSRKPPASETSARGQSRKPPASAKTPVSTTSARSARSARARSVKPPASKISNVRRQSGIPRELTGLYPIPENTFDLKRTGHADTDTDMDTND